VEGFGEGDDHSFWILGRWLVRLTGVEGKRVFGIWEAVVGGAANF